MPATLVTFSLLSGIRSRADAHGKADPPPAPAQLSANDRLISSHAQRQLEEGRRIFRHDTFGSEATPPPTPPFF